jgi:hypothetical protein
MPKLINTSSPTRRHNNFSETTLNRLQIFNNVPNASIKLSDKPIKGALRSSVLSLNNNMQFDH